MELTSKSKKNLPVHCSREDTVFSGSQNELEFKLSKQERVDKQKKHPFSIQGVHVSNESQKFPSVVKLLVTDLHVD